MTTTIINGTDTGKLTQRVKAVNLATRSSYVFNASEGFNPTFFNSYRFVVRGALPGTDGAHFYIRVSEHSGAAGYGYVGRHANETGLSAGFVASASDTEVEAILDIGSVASDEMGVSGTVEAIHLGSSTLFPIVKYDLYTVNTGNTSYMNRGFGRRKSAAQITSIDFVLSTGTFESGEIDIIGTLR